jgi:Family of unknown function (DUF5958)
MKIEDQILLNKFGQGLLSADDVIAIFDSIDIEDKKAFFSDLIDLIIQSKATDEDVEPAIRFSGLKHTFTPCILLLRGGTTSHNLAKIADLPLNEAKKSFVLLVHLFRLAYQRRFHHEKNDPNKWWYWDMSDDEVVEKITRLPVF